MDLLTEHKTVGLVGEERVRELREALAGARAVLRSETSETYGLSTVATPASSPPLGTQTTAGQATAAAAAPAAPAGREPSPGDLDTLRRCNALLAAHVHSGVTGKTLEDLRDSLAESIRIVDAQIGYDRPGGPPAGSGASRASQAVEPAGRGGAAPGNDGPIPGSVNGMHSVGSVISEMGIGKEPASFEPEGDLPPATSGSGRWVEEGLGEDEKRVATRALGYLLKHRGGKGYGRGRVRGAEAESMISALAEVTEILQEEMVEG